MLNRKIPIKPLSTLYGSLCWSKCNQSPCGEICLLSKPGKTQLIAIGKKVDDYLKEKSLSQRVYRVLHYTKRAASHINGAIEPWLGQFPSFSAAVAEADFEDSIKDVLGDADMDCYIDDRPRGGKPYLTDPKKTDSRRKLMFYYKNKFSQIREGTRA